MYYSFYLEGIYQGEIYLKDQKEIDSFINSYPKEFNILLEPNY
jgi:hypothetical protein